MFNIISVGGGSSSSRPGADTSVSDSSVSLRMQDAADGVRSLDPALIVEDESLS